MVQRGTSELAESELMRFLGEAAWYPTALLPSQTVQWHAVNGSSAKATLQDGDVSVTALFRFDQDGLIESLTARRGRLVGDISVPTKWVGRFGNYQRCNGMFIPTKGEVS